MVFRGSVSIEVPAPTGKPKNWDKRVSTQMLQKHPSKNPYGAKEVSDSYKVFAWYLVRLGNRTYRAWDRVGYF